MKSNIVAKFGGSSLADSTQFAKAKEIVLSDPNRRFVVPSAPGKRHANDHKVTDLLYLCHQLASHGLGFNDVYVLIEKRYIGICDELGIDLDIRGVLKDIHKQIEGGASRDFTASRGEYLNARVLSRYLDFEFIDATELIAFKKGGKFDDAATQAKVSEKLGGASHAVVPGFYGALPDGEIKTFSRGGSDITGAIIARGVGADLYENWTDVSGFLMANPKIVDNPRPIEIITYSELRELSYMGASVLHEEAIFPVKREGIPINIKNTNAPDEPGTLIVSDDSAEESTGTITGVAGKKDFTVVAIEKTLMGAEKGFFRKLMSIMETNDIAVEHMPSGIDSVSLVVSNTELNSKLEKVVEEIRIYCGPDSITCYPNMALVAVVGRGMIKTKGIAAKIFGALADEGVNIRMINQGSSELNIIIGVENGDFERAVNAIYSAF